MALVITLTATGASEPQPGRMLITINMVCEDASVEVINQDFVADKRDAIPLSVIGERVRLEMQEVIDRYKREQQILLSSQLASAISTLQGQLVG